MRAPALPLFYGRFGLTAAAVANGDYYYYYECNINKLSWPLDHLRMIRRAGLRGGGAAGRPASRCPANRRDGNNDEASLRRSRVLLPPRMMMMMISRFGAPSPASYLGLAVCGELLNSIMLCVLLHHHHHLRRRRRRRRRPRPEAGEWPAAERRATSNSKFIFFLCKSEKNSS